MLTKVCIVKAMVFPEVLYGCWELDHKEGWAPKNSCFWTVVLEKTLESPLDNKENRPVSPKVNQLWIFIERTDAEAEVPILWPLDAKSRLIGKDPGAGEDWGQKEKGATEDEMVRWHHQLNGHVFEQILGDSEGEGSLVCCSSWGCSQTWTTQQEQLRCLDTHKKPLSTTPELMLMKCLLERRGEGDWRLAKVQWPVT